MLLSDANFHDRTIFQLQCFEHVDSVLSENGTEIINLRLFIRLMQIPCEIDRLIITSKLFIIYYVLLSAKIFAPA
jgi:hypothetical protein